MWMIHTYYSKFFEVLFPKQCFLCKEKNTSLCTVCLRSFTRPIDTPFLFIKSFYCFKDSRIKKIIHAIKYFHRKDLIIPLTENIIQEIINENYNGILVPIPMPTIRKYVRGYNQAEVLAHYVSLRCHVPIDTKILTRSHSPKRQVKTKTRSERLNNQHDTFRIIKSVKNLNIILIDDVTTTGATLHEARKILLAHGASSVSAVTLAH